MLEDYRRHCAERAALGIPPRPLDAAQTRALCQLLVEPPAEQGAFLVSLLAERVPPGVDPAAEVKAAWLGQVVSGAVRSPALSPLQALQLCGNMLGGYNLPVLLAALDGPLAGTAADLLGRTILVFDRFEAVAAKAEAGHPHARKVLEAWADGLWFTAAPALPEVILGTVHRIPGETNTDDLSPATAASTRPDIPLHATTFLANKHPQARAELAAQRQAGRQPIIVGDLFGTGSSRKSATNSLLWWIGQDLPGVPNKRRGGVLIARSIAPIFLNTLRDAGGLPIVATVDGLAHGDQIEVLPAAGELRRQGSVVARFRLDPASLADEYRAGGRTNLIIGRALTARAQARLGRPSATVASVATDQPAGGYTLAQKLVGRACDRPGVAPGESVEPRIATVGSQDTTGPMTADELSELACLGFAADLVMQSFCHTAAYPKAVDAAMHRKLAGFMSSRGGVALRPGDGVIHSWLNRLCLPDTVGTGGDSHTRFPLGISFPAGSGLVAFAAALGSMPLDMPESVRVRFTGRLRPDLTLRDLVNAIPYEALRKGDLVLGQANPFNGRILEIEGLEHLRVDEAFELTNASAERSAAAATIALGVDRVAEWLKTSVILLRSLAEQGYQHRDTLLRRAAAMEVWLARPALLRADPGAGYAYDYTIDCSGLAEPLLACPNDPDRIKPLSEVAGTRIDEVFIGSCMVHLDHFRTAAAILEAPGCDYVQAVTWIAPATRLEDASLRQEGQMAIFGARGCRLEMPGCSLCMGNQARVRPGATVVSTSTRNFDHRLGQGAQVYLASTPVCALAARLGRLPTLEEYRKLYPVTARR